MGSLQLYNQVEGGLVADPTGRVGLGATGVANVERMVQVVT